MCGGGQRWFGKFCFFPFPTSLPFFSPGCVVPVPSNKNSCTRTHVARPSLIGQPHNPLLTYTALIFFPLPDANILARVGRCCIHLARVNGMVPSGRLAIKRSLSTIYICGWESATITASPPLEIQSQRSRLRRSATQNTILEGTACMYGLKITYYDEPFTDIDHHQLTVLLALSLKLNMNRQVSLGGACSRFMCIRVSTAYPRTSLSPRLS